MWRSLLALIPALEADLHLDNATCTRRKTSDHSTAGTGPLSRLAIQSRAHAAENLSALPLSAKSLCAAWRCLGSDGHRRYAKFRAKGELKRLASCASRALRLREVVFAKLEIKACCLALAWLNWMARLLFNAPPARNVFAHNPRRCAVYG